MQTAPNQIRTKPRPLCYLCGEPGNTLYKELHDFIFDAPGRWELKECTASTCGLVWLDPFPIEEDLHLAYQTYYTHKENGGNSKPGGKFRDVLYKTYAFANSLPGVILGLQSEKKRMSFMFLDELPPGRVLDVGCGDGTFLNRIRKTGWSVEGFDFDEKVLTSAKAKYGLDLKHGDIKSLGFQKESFDAITLNHVIEHVPDPLEMFAECRSLLKPGGRLVMTTPNTASLGHKTFQRHWRGLEPPRHLHLFSARTLKVCAVRSGLEVIRASTTAAHADIVGGASYSIRESPDHRTPIFPPPNLARTLKSMLFQYREQLQTHRHPELGEEAVLVCQRK
jgi:2-polyprenyl-3-methyl-5-hydroxy-6-metoxy-1,4-benzoquinol methylase